MALTETFNSPWHSSNSNQQEEGNGDFVGQVFLKCSALQILEYCGAMAKQLAKQAYGTELQVPELRFQGHLEATFPYVISHLEYIIGELLRNSIQAVMERSRDLLSTPAPIEVLVCEAPQHVIFRVSDQGGGIPRDVLPHLWSFSKGPRRQSRLQNLLQVPKMAATVQDLELPGPLTSSPASGAAQSRQYQNSSLRSLTSRQPSLRLGMGLPMSRVYAEYWAGSLEVHSLEGYGVDAFLQISKLGNKNEQLSTRAIMDAV